MSAFADRVPPSLRGLLRQQRFAALAVASLGIAIALNTTMYSVTDALLFPKVAMKDPENLYRMPFYGDYRRRLTAQQRMEAVQGLTFYESSALRQANYLASNLAERGSRSRTARVYSVSTNYFELLGVATLAGRLFVAEDSCNTAHQVVVRERFWNQMFPVDRGPVLDVALFAAAAATLFTTTLLACYMPARRAMRINPVEALRAE